MWLNETQRPCDDDAGGRDWRRVVVLLDILIALLSDDGECDDERGKTPLRKQGDYKKA